MVFNTYFCFHITYFTHYITLKFKKLNMCYSVLATKRELKEILLTVFNYQQIKWILKNYQMT